jgi:putative chitinase
VSPDQIKRLQRNVGVTADGIIGRGTLTALFAKLGASPERAAELALGANVHLPAAGILDDPLRLAHFLAQIGHESGGFRWMEEIASGEAYEGRADLGNTHLGDGKRYKGRGPLQNTGRANYRELGRKIGIDLESHPEIVAFPSVGIWTACLFWTSRGLNALADQDDILGITKKVNGGTNGLADRKVWLTRTKALVL